MVVNDALAVVMLTTVITSGVTIISVAKMLIGRKQQSPIAPSHLAEIEAQLRQLSASLDAVAIEVERISEGQRFTTKLLAERPMPADAPRIPPKSITPH